MLEKLLKDKGKEVNDKMDDKYKSAKMGVLKQIHEMASNSMGDEVKGLKKVEVAAPDKAGLALGLDKAKDLVGGDSDDDEGMEDPIEEASESPAFEKIENDVEEGDLSSEEIDELEKFLEEQKAKLLAKS